MLGHAEEEGGIRLAALEEGGEGGVGFVGDFEVLHGVTCRKVSWLCAHKQIVNGVVAIRQNKVPWSDPYQSRTTAPTNIIA